ncbi:MAG: glycoside hydrolase family 130 protein, partial [Propionicimonas sp.]|nr:glycoside hydrolase family 130 protein [Propionicimonas sp.]
MSIVAGQESCPNLPWEPRPAGSDGVLWRFSGNPVLGWNPTASTARIYNSAVVPFGDGFAGVFRADHRTGTAALHAGFSADGLAWDIDDRPIQWRDEDGEPFQPGYGYDPRVVRIGDRFYICWCVDFGGAALGLGYTEDFRTFVRLENPVTPFNRNGVLFPRKINGTYRLLTRPSDSGHTPFGDIFISESRDLTFWGRHRRVMMSMKDLWWQSVKIGAGPVPIETSEGWLLFYHGVSGTANGLVYSIGAALLDLDDPARVLYRSRGYLLTPELPYETTGFVPNVCFPCATLCDGATGRLAIYYGAADTYSALAFGYVDG